LLGISLTYNVYLKKKTLLPDSEGSVSSSIASNVMAAANQEVKGLLKNSDAGSKCGQHGPCNR